MDELVAIDGSVRRGVLDYQQLLGEADLVASVRLGGISLAADVPTRPRTSLRHPRLR